MLRVQPKESLDYRSFLTYIQRVRGNVILGDRSTIGGDGFMTGAPWEQQGNVQYAYANAPIQDNTGGLLRNAPGSLNQELADTAVIKKVCDAMRRHRRRLEKLFRVQDRDQSGQLSRAQFLRTLQQIGIGIDDRLCVRAFQLLVPDEQRGETLNYESLIDRLDLDPYRPKIPLHHAEGGGSLEAADSGVIAADAMHFPPSEKVAFLRRRLCGLDANALQTFKRNDVNYDGRLTVQQLQRSLKTICPELTEADVAGLFHHARAEHETRPGAEPFTYRHFVRIYTAETSPIDDQGPQASAPGPLTLSQRRAASARPAAASLASTAARTSYPRPVTSFPIGREGSPTRGGGEGASSVILASSMHGGPPSLGAWVPGASSKLAASQQALQFPPDAPFATFGKHLTLPTWKTSVRGGVPLAERPDLNASSTSIFNTWAAAEPLGKYGRKAWAPPAKDTRHITEPLHGTSQFGADRSRFVSREEGIRALQEGDRTRKEAVAEARQDRMRRHAHQVEDRKERDQVQAENLEDARANARRVQTRRFFERVSLYDRIAESGGEKGAVSFFSSS